MMEDLGVAPLVSIVVPVYNAADFIDQCIASIVAQHYENWELWCVDDGSQDASSAIIKDYGATDERIHLIELEHVGPGKARNIGLASACGDYVLCLDSDDFIDERTLELAVARAEETSADIVIWDVWFYNHKAKRRQHPPAEALVFENYASCGEVFNWHDNPDRIFCSFQNWCWNKLFRQAFLKEHAIAFDEDIFRTEDLCFTAVALYKAERITLLEDRLTFYRTNRANSAMSTKDAFPRDFLVAFIRLRHHLEEDGLYEVLRRSYVNWAVLGAFANLMTLHTPQAYKAVYEELKESGFAALDGWGHDEEYFFDHWLWVDLEALHDMDALEFLHQRYWRVETGIGDTIALVDFLNDDADRERAAYRETIAAKDGEIEELRRRIELKDEELRQADMLLRDTAEEMDAILNAAEQRVGRLICAVPRRIQRVVLDWQEARERE